MARRGHSTSIGKFAKVHHDRRVSEIRMLGELLRRERQSDLPLRERYAVHVDRPTVHHG
ncbi:hypothetical protein KZZ52_41840 [Dactylosporangium sp. AC04546]|uniref:hypothetical protein n=1 Tax=Dactylosporangium sp. AC04546 TaxID=2862460 RepID=UPI001EDDE321|nr:hypothetical protein [Dactylosporangium sp. AC04546]WVK80469.1 hypothetical protein KZZ52_41840 [Dactylosporangium sp. AC04546]